MLIALSLDAQSTTYKNINNYLTHSTSLDSIQKKKYISVELAPLSFINGIIKVGAEIYLNHNHSFKLTLGYGFADSAVIYKGVTNITELMLEGEFRYYISRINPERELTLNGFFLGGYGLAKQIEFNVLAIKRNPITRTETYTVIDKDFKAKAVAFGYLTGYRAVLKSFYAEAYLGSGLMYSNGDNQYINQNINLTQLKYRTSIMPYGGIRVGFYL